MDFIASDIPGWTLFRFYLLAMYSDADGAIVHGLWDAVRPFSVSNRQVEKACNDLLSRGYLYFPTTNPRPVFEISDKGIALIEAIFLNHREVITKHQADNSLMRDEITTILRRQIIPAADRVVTLDDNDPYKKEAVRRVNDIVEAVRGKNDIDPEIKEAALAELASVQSILGRAKVWASSLYELTIEKIMRLKAKIEEKAIGTLADLAIEALKNLYKSLIG